MHARSTDYPELFGGGGGGGVGLVLRPVSTPENKHRIGLDFFPSCIILSAGPKKVENTSTLYHPADIYPATDEFSVLTFPSFCVLPHKNVCVKLCKSKFMFSGQCQHC